MNWVFFSIPSFSPSTYTIPWKVVFLLVSKQQVINKCLLCAHACIVAEMSEKELWESCFLKSKKEFGSLMQIMDPNPNPVRRTRKVPSTLLRELKNYNFTQIHLPKTRGCLCRQDCPKTTGPSLEKNTWLLSQDAQGHGFSRCTPLAQEWPATSTWYMMVLSQCQQLN